MRQAVLNLEESMIRQVANAAMGRDDVLKFWFGESDEVTPAFIRQAAADSLTSGETFYAHNLGLPELREEIVRYCSAAMSSGTRRRPLPTAAQRAAAPRPSSSSAAMPSGTRRSSTYSSRTFAPLRTLGSLTSLHTRMAGSETVYVVRSVTMSSCRLTGLPGVARLCKGQSAERRCRE